MTGSTAPSLDLRSALPNDAKPQTIAIVGAGGHGRELADIVRAIHAVDENVSLLGVVDDGDPDRSTLARAGIRFLGARSVLAGRELDVYLGVGSPTVRAQLANESTDPSSCLIHPSATVGSDAHIGWGSVLAQGVIVTTNVEIGRHSHINVATSISHDCRIGDFVTVAPGARLTGNVCVGDQAFIGAAATVLPGLRIGRGATVGAGALVTKDVASGTTVMGVPARRVDGS
jgi:sugar O-acyltransferase (sialic acid O-acetyltransferase NeuD family)